MTSETIRVGLGERSYDVVVAPGVLGQAGGLIRPLLKRARVAVVTDATVAGLHLAALGAALDAAELAEVPIELVTIHTETEAANTRFGGSPTILVDGVDLFPTTPARSLACRVYATGSGYAGAPTQEQIEAALRGASR